jgi:outer membrane lipoprotein-sorting protein
MTKRDFGGLLAYVCLFLFFGNLEAATRDEGRILSVAQKMETAFTRVADYTCEVEQIFYQDGTENQRYRFKFYFKKKKKIRVDFSYPHSGLTILSDNSDKEATVIPSRSLSIFKFRLSVDNPLLRTLAGQKINQTDMGYFINFIFNNLEKVGQKGNIFFEDERRIEFVFWALDYIEEKSLEKYRVSVSKKDWLPIRIERYGSEDKLLEVTDIKDYRINTHLEDKLFQP